MARRAMGERWEPSRRESIFGKLIISSCVLVGFSLLMSDIFAYRYTYAILQQQYVDAEKTQITTLSRQFTYLTSDIEKLAVSEALDSDVQRYLRSPIPDDSYEKYSTINKISKKLSMFAVQRDYLLNMTIVKSEEPLADHDIVLSAMQTDFGLDAQSYKQELQSAWYRRIPKDQRDFFSSPYNLKLAHSEIDLLPYVLHIADMNDPNKIIGEIILNLRYDHLKETFASYTENRDYHYWFGSSGEELYRKVPADPGISDGTVREFLGRAKPGGLSSFQDSFGYVFVDRSMDNGWTFVTVLSRASVIRKLRKIIYFFVGYTAFILAVVFAVLFPLVLGITRPLSRLALAMRQVSGGNMDVVLSVDTRDEVGYLAYCFNTMLSDLKEHTRREAAYEKTEKEMQLNLLMAQINPHFIYNTLQTIVYMAKKIGAENIVDMTSSFIGVLQDIVRISDRGLLSTLGQEVEVLKQYLVIQQYRYRDRFQVRWNLDETILGERVPRSVLQPLVENSLAHGILPSGRIGTIEIRVEGEEERILVTVRDDGVGMEENRIKEVFNATVEESRTGELRSIGIRNVDGRIKYLCGETFGISIESELGSYTKVRVTLPRGL